MSWALDHVILKVDEHAPVDWRTLSSSGKIFVEIGFGNGEFLEFLAKTYPDTLIIGVEVSQWCAAKAARRVMSAELTNVRILHGDARFLLARCFPQESVARVYMNYPCPWPKTRHASRRVTVPFFAGLLNDLLEVGGTFELATDVDWYARECAETMIHSGAFDAEPVVTNPNRPYVTKYERKWKAMNKDTWLLTVKKNGKKPSQTATEEEWPMEVDTTNATKTVRAILDELQDKSGVGTNGTGKWVFRETFLSEDGVGLILTITADEGFEQHFYLKVIPKVKGYSIKVDSVGHPYRTPAMRAALGYALKTAENA